jgi:hypothetical protein
MYNFVHKQKLKNELKFLYSNEIFANFTKITGLYKFIIDKDLVTILPATVKAIEIVLTVLIASAEAERCFSTLKRIKYFLRSTMGENRLNALAVSSIERQFNLNIKDFNSKVISKFAMQIDRRRTVYIFK